MIQERLHRIKTYRACRVFHRVFGNCYTELFYAGVYSVHLCGDLRGLDVASIIVGLIVVMHVGISIAHIVGEA